ncbi:MAG: methyltransferase domain-containing protein [Candidatus Paceibacterota bacterium]|jgi:tellurite methyltransferase
MSNKYDEIYATPNIDFRGGKPQQAVKKITELIKSGEVLDIGGGEGRNALFLADAGFQVTLIDLSRVGVEKFKKEAKKRNLVVRSHIADIVEIGVIQSYDVIVVSYVFQHITDFAARKVIEQMKEKTRAGGFNVVSVLTAEGDFYNENPSTKNFYPKPNELKEIYNDWEIIAYDKMDSRALRNRTDGTPMVNNAEVLIARKNCGRNF